MDLKSPEQGVSKKEYHHTENGHIQEVHHIRHPVINNHIPGECDEMIQGINRVKIKWEIQNGFVKNRRRKPEQVGQNRPEIINIIYIDPGGCKKKAGRQNKGGEYHEDESIESKIDKREAGKIKNSGDDDYFKRVYKNTHAKRGEYEEFGSGIQFGYKVGIGVYAVGGRLSRLSKKIE